MHSDWPSIDTIIGVISGVLCVCFGIISYLAYRDGRAQKRKLELVEERLSTRYLGEFPDYMPALIELVGSARKSLYFCSTTPILGYFSAPDEYRLLKSCFDVLIFGDHRIDVTAILTDDSARRSLLEQQFQAATRDWTTWRNENLKLLTRFAERIAVDLDTFSPDNLIFRLNEYTTADFEYLRKSKATVFETPYHHSVNIWIADRKTAIFSFPVSKPTYRHHAFWTRDRDLVNTLIGILDHLRADANKHHEITFQAQGLAFEWPSNRSADLQGPTPSSPQKRQSE